MAEARVLRRGRDLAFLDVALSSRAGHAICRGLLIYQASDYAGRTPRLRAEHALLAAPSPLTPPAAHRLFRGYVEKLEITPLHQSPGRVRLHMPCTPMHVDERGQLHAGALASIVDIAAVAASWSLVPRRQGARGSTIGMQVSYPSAAACGRGRRRPRAAALGAIALQYRPRHLGRLGAARRHGPGHLSPAGALAGGIGGSHASMRCSSRSSSRSRLRITSSSIAPSARRRRSASRSESMIVRLISRCSMSSRSSPSVDGSRCRSTCSERSRYMSRSRSSSGRCPGQTS